jgi:hypothetical protein
MIEELAIRAARYVSQHGREKLTSGALWIPLQLLYVEMLAKKQVTAFSEIGRDKMLLYWTQACLSGEKPKWVKIGKAQALYLFDLIIENENNNG